MQAETCNTPLVSRSLWQLSTSLTRRSAAHSLGHKIIKEGNVFIIQALKHRNTELITFAVNSCSVYTAERVLVL